MIDRLYNTYQQFINMDEQLIKNREELFFMCRKQRMKEVAKFWQRIYIFLVFVHKLINQNNEDNVLIWYILDLILEFQYFNNSDV